MAAQVYFENGISLLGSTHWQEQYTLSLDLYNWSVLVCFMNGNVESIPSRLDEIMANARSFDDTLDSRIIRAKYLTAQGKFALSISGVLEALSIYLGESFPNEINDSMVTNEMNAIAPMLKEISKESILSLPAMTDKTKMHAMKFMNLLTSMCHQSAPRLLPFISSRMTRLTFKVSVVH